MPIPEREGETESLLEVGNSTDAILAPAISARPRVVMREIIPRIAVRAVIFADCSPCALAQIRSPKIPALSGTIILRDPTLLGVHANAVLSYRSLKAKFLLRTAEIANRKSDQ